MPLPFQINLISKCLKATAFYNAMNIIHAFAVFMRERKSKKSVSKCSVCKICRLIISTE